MRILINAVSARAGGGIAYLINLLQTLPAMCPSIEFLAVIPELSLPENPAAHNNLEIRVIKEASGNPFNRYLWENSGLIKLCRSWRADQLFCVANIIPLVNPGIPVTVMIQNVAPLTPRVLTMLRQLEPIGKYLQMLFLQKLTLMAIKRAAVTISLSQATASLLKEWVPGINSPVLYHGISSTFNPAAPKPAAAGNEPYLLYVSNIYVYKGLEYIVEAIAINRTLPRIFIAGKIFDLGYQKMINNLIVKHKVADRLVFLNSIDQNELPGWYANAQAMVYTSWCENCPNILLEAMACGCPIVAFNTGPMPEICQEAGLYASPFDSQSLATTIAKVISGDQQQIKKLAIARASEFTWEKAMQRHAQILSDKTQSDRLQQSV